jgi:hypothetical protein
VKGFDMSWRTATAVFILLALVFAAGCRQPRTYATQVEALTEFPGYLSAGNRDSFQLLARRELPLGDVLLYTFAGARPNEKCVATTFVSEEGDGRWRAQSAARLGCQAGFPESETIILAYTAGGNITGLATVYGLAPGGATVRVRWTDGEATTADIEDGYLLVSRPETIPPQVIEILDVAGNVIHIEPGPE